MVSAGSHPLPLLFGHQGGWDEALLVVGPLVVIGGLLYLANKRLKARLDEMAEFDGDPAQATKATPKKSAKK